MTDGPRKSQAELLAEMSCGVCGGGDVIGVCSSPFGPMSDATCRTCLEMPAVSFPTFQYLYEDVSDRGEGLTPMIQSYFTHRDGAYLSWPDYVAERRASE